jgi:hypothetical protein
MLLFNAYDRVEFSQVQKARNPGSDRIGVQLHIQFYAEFPVRLGITIQNVL